MLKIKEAIVVEGKYDKAKLSKVVDCLIIETNGFRIFTDKIKLNLIRKLAEKEGIIVFTDSDASGFMIRNFIKTSVQKGLVKHAYAPSIKGKEKRKDRVSKEGLLGVEGMTEDIIVDCLMKATVCKIEENNFPKITKQDLYDLGLYGKEDSKNKRAKLLKKLDLPQYISTNELLSILNAFLVRENLEKQIKRLLSGE